MQLSILNVTQLSVLTFIFLQWIPTTSRNKSLLIFGFSLSAFFIHSLNQSGIFHGNHWSIFLCYFVFIGLLYRKATKLILWMLVLCILWSIVNVSINTINEMFCQHSMSQLSVLLAKNGLNLLFLCIHIALLKNTKLRIFTEIMEVILILLLGASAMMDHMHLNMEEVFFLLLIIMTYLMILLSFLFYALFNIGLHSRLETMQVQAQKMDNHFYQIIQQKNDNRYFMHDLLKECHSLSTLVEKKDYETLQQRIDYLANVTCKEFNYMQSDSIIINTLIASKINFIEYYDIHITISVNDSDLTFIDLYDQYDLFYHLLELSLQEVIKANTNRYIHIKSKKLKNHTILQCTLNNNHRKLDKKIDNIIKPLSSRYHISAHVKDISSNRLSIILMIQN